MRFLIVRALHVALDLLLQSAKQMPSTKFQITPLLYYSFCIIFLISSKVFRLSTRIETNTRDPVRLQQIPDKVWYDHLASKHRHGQRHQVHMHMLKALILVMQRTIIGVAKSAPIMLKTYTKSSKFSAMIIAINHMLRHNTPKIWNIKQARSLAKL